MSPTLRGLARSRRATAGAVLILAVASAAVLAPVFCRVLPAAHRDPAAQDFAHGLTPLGAPVGPSREWPLGADMLGRDELARVLYGARASLEVGVTAAALALAVGLAAGVAAGALRGWVDGVLMRLTDLVLAFPFVLFCVALAATRRAGIGTTVCVLAAAAWAPIARVARAKALAVREREFVLAARMVGAGDGRVLCRHVLPHVAGPAAALATVGVAGLVLGEAALSFLGVGVPPPTPAWGSMLAAAAPYARSAPWLIVAPAVALVITVLGFHLLGEGLREVVDPRSGR